MFGGTFDPPHVGHMVAAKAVRDACDLDRVIFVVANKPWMKSQGRAARGGSQQGSRGQGGSQQNEAQQGSSQQSSRGQKVSPAKHRLAMVEAAVADQSWCEVSDIEIERGGESYTADTIKQLRKAQPNAEFYVIIGSDVAPHLESWKQPKVIREQTKLVVLERPGSVGTALPKGWEAKRVSGKLMDISSSQIRDWVSQGRPTEYILPVGVAEVIAERGLYGSGELKGRTYRASSR